MGTAHIVPFLVYTLYLVSITYQIIVRIIQCCKTDCYVTPVRRNRQFVTVQNGSGYSITLILYTCENDTWCILTFFEMRRDERNETTHRARQYHIFLDVIAWLSFREFYILSQIVRSEWFCVTGCGVVFVDTAFAYNPQITTSVFCQRQYNAFVIIKLFQCSEQYLVLQKIS